MSTSIVFAVAIDQSLALDVADNNALVDNVAPSIAPVSFEISIDTCFYKINLSVSDSINQLQK